MKGPKRETYHVLYSFQIIKKITRCDLISIPSVVHHSPQFEIGWKAGWLQANKESHNAKKTYGVNCNKY
ncbi:MAG: hypothetical protein WAK17_01340 [Candidatus Nitrosopolaris sp.]|jgi:hypothetical protein